MVRNAVKIGEVPYKSQIECERDVRKKLKNAGVTLSVKDKSHDLFIFLHNLCKRHPYQEKKLQNMVDFSIRNDALNRDAFAIDIINNNETTTEISWRICVSGKNHKPEKLYYMALRDSISHQIETYRIRADKTHCSMCNDCLIGKIHHIDHENHFAQIVDEFNKLYNITIPTEYNKKPITFIRTFLFEDQWIGEKFYNFHLERAKLRIVCKNCNLTRNKYRKP